jgi:hypothetical protein
LAAIMSGCCATKTVDPEHARWTLTDSDSDGDRYIVVIIQDMAIGTCLSDPMPDNIRAYIGGVESRIGDCLLGTAEWQPGGSAKALKVRALVNGTAGKPQEARDSALALRIVATGTFSCRNVLVVPLSQEGLRVFAQAMRFLDSAHEK